MPIVLDHVSLGALPDSALFEAPWLAPPWKVVAATQVKEDTPIARVPAQDLDEAAQKACGAAWCSLVLHPGEFIFELYRSGKPREFVYSTGVPGKNPTVTLVARKVNLLAEPTSFSPSQSIVLKFVPRAEVVIDAPAPPAPKPANKLLWALVGLGLIYGLS